MLQEGTKATQFVDGGWALYSVENGEPVVRNIPEDNTGLVEAVNQAGGQATDEQEAIQHTITSNNLLILDREIEDIATNGLVFHIDPKSRSSYPGFGDIVYSMTDRASGNAELYGAQVDLEGSIVFRGQGERDGNPSGDYIELPGADTTTDPHQKPEGVTYNIWMVFDDNQPVGHSIMYGSGTKNHLEWRGSVTGGSWRTEARLDNGYSFGASGESSYGHHQIGEWFNLCLVFDNQGQRPVSWYINGQKFFEKPMTLGDRPGDEHFRPVYFGRATGSTSYLYSQSFLGRLGIFSIYNRALTQQEINQNYTAYENRFL
jgi:hypothetical protein